MAAILELDEHRQHRFQIFEAAPQEQRTAAGGLATTGFSSAVGPSASGGGITGSFTGYPALHAGMLPNASGAGGPFGLSSSLMFARKPPPDYFL